MTQQEREYVIILKNHQDLDSFYEDMESQYGDAEIPNRTIECAYRRPNSRSTHYYLTDSEAQQVAKDSRVLAIELTYREMGQEFTTLSGIQFSDYWDKSTTSNATDSNWGLYRAYNRAPVSNWGRDGTAAVSGTINLKTLGRNVDVVIIDGTIVPNHPEWAVNADGTGGSRLVQFNWFQYNQEVRAVAAGTYVYDFRSGGDTDNNHGNNVAAIACGNTNGWARKANIYNISSLTTQTTNSDGYANYVYDAINYVREWHKRKAINPATGRKNPTICNLSYGSSTTVDINSSGIGAKIYYQGTEYTRPTTWSNNDRIYFGLVAGSVTFHSRNASLDQDVIDAINDGIIMVGSAGNAYMYNDIDTGVNYNNAISWSPIPGVVQPFPYYYYHRGPSPACATGCICVSAIDDTVSERKANYSNAGPRTDIFAPGTSIMGASYTSQAADSRNASFYKYKSAGTSQAAPQVTGILACALETYPAMTQAQARAYIRGIATQDQLTGGGTFTTTYPSTSYVNYNTLYGADNLYLGYLNERTGAGIQFPRNSFMARNTTGRTYPRTRVRKYG